MSEQDKEMTFRAKVKLPLHPFWLVSVGGIAILFSFLYWTVFLFGSKDGEGMWFFVAFFLINYVILILIFLYRLWHIVQKSNLGIKKPTPDRAVGFLFIPFFNLYWLFIAYRNLAFHLNSLTKYKKISTKVVTLGVALLVSGVLIPIGEVILPALLSMNDDALWVTFLVSVVLSPIGGTVLLIVNFSFYRSAKELWLESDRTSQVASNKKSWRRKILLSIFSIVTIGFLIGIFAEKIIPKPHRLQTEAGTLASEAGLLVTSYVLATKKGTITEKDAEVDSELRREMYTRRNACIMSIDSKIVNGWERDNNGWVELTPGHHSYMYIVAYPKWKEEKQPTYFASGELDAEAHGVYMISGEQTESYHWGKWSNKQFQDSSHMDKTSYRYDQITGFVSHPKDSNLSFKLK